MGWRTTITLHTYLLLSCSSLFAQQVSYCEPYSDRFTLRQEMMGKVGDFYWVSATTRKKAVRHGNEISGTEERNFVVYDGRMGVKGMIDDPPYTNKSIREYLVMTDEHFDRVNLLTADGKETEVRLQRYEPDGEALEPDHTIGVFPFNEPGTSFMLVRSLDRTRILLLGFQFIASSAPYLHAYLYDEDWHLLSQKIYRHPYLSQPMIQDDFSTYPLEDFNKTPIKLADNGEWLMMSPSRQNSNFLLFQFSPLDTVVSYKEIMLPGTSSMEDVCLSVDNTTREAVAGILSNFHYAPLKNVQVVHYSMHTKTFSFDSSYRLNTLSGKRVRNDNLVKENFVSVPGKGFLLMKEYGRQYEELDDNPYDDGWDPAFLFASNDIPDPNTGPSFARMRLPGPRYGYARYRETANPPYHDRGDLSLYYFPASRGDSCWSGMISQEQVTELNSPNLSYMMVPMQDRIVFLYNSFVHGEKIYASTTVIDPRGEQVTNEGILFWGLKNTLDFQQSRQVAPDQVVIPYDIYVNGNANGKVGFAVVLFR
ncbi:hypothetical protein [Puia dinghuensis]|uniref:Uncharacterized protein n=1 Tax=Puia dinghuensis TaxID=1792502 RepID=A0A8J2XVB9_9BACT|nr:hypothetical protein [Puia dinghuensis]GGB17330.1 hypothetical protein GCM10011511_46400 [Puia dinghuensis]